MIHGSNSSLRRKYCIFVLTTILVHVTVLVMCHVRLVHMAQTALVFVNVVKMVDVIRQTVLVSV